MTDHNGRYILSEQGSPVPEPDLLKWTKAMNEYRRLASTTVDDVLISTVFLGLDHSFGSGEPVLWETMIFGGKHDQYQERYTSRADALVGHAKAIELVKPAP